MNNPSLFTEFDETTNGLLRAVAPFTPEMFNRVPFAGSWTAAQVVEHLLKSLSGIPFIVQGNTRLSDRQPDEKVAVIQSIFLDFTTKLQSPKETHPSSDAQEKETLITAWNQMCTQIKHIMQEADLSRICTDFPFPTVGELTGHEWIYFAIAHTQRHTRQIRNIHAQLAHLPV